MSERLLSNTGTQDLVMRVRWPVLFRDDKTKIHLDIQKTGSPPSDVQSTQKKAESLSAAFLLLYFRPHYINTCRSELLGLLYYLPTHFNA